MVDLTTNYLGIPLKNPLIAAASPLSKKAEWVQKMQESSISAVVLYSLFEEEIEYDSFKLDHFLTKGTESYAEAITYFPDLGKYNIGVDKYIRYIEELKTAVDIPVIASLNGISSGGWIDTAIKIEQAGADALELNIYFVVTEIETSSEELEQAYVDLVSDIRNHIKIPLSVKISPYITALPNFTDRLIKAGADGIVLFNRFLQPDIDIEKLEVNTQLELSTSAEIRLPLRWISILYPQIKADLAHSTGVHKAADIIKSIMAGAKVVQLASRLINRGIPNAEEIIFDLRRWMTEHEYESIEKMRGSMSHQSIKEPAAFERANYMKMLSSYDDKIR